MPYKLECSTIAKRNRIVKRMIALAVRHGAEYTVDRSDPLDINVLISLNGYAVRTHFTGRTQVNSFLGHWFTGVSNPGQTYPQDFDRTIGGTMNRHHFGKATSYAGTFEEFHQSLDAGLAQLSPLRAAA